MTSKQKIAILNSRQGLHPCRSHQWVQQTLQLLEHIKNLNPLIVSSIGMTTWDIVTIISRNLDFKIELHVLLPKNTQELEYKNYLINEFNLNQLKTSFIYYENLTKIDFQNQRDTSIIETADTLFPISIRKNGNLENIILQNSTKVDRSFQTKYQKLKVKHAYDLLNVKLTEEIDTMPNDYYIHWTKSPKDKWSFESYYNYYNAILHSDYYPRTAFQTLQNIVHSKTIFASATHMPKNTPTVSFTSLSPIDTIPLFKWRSRYQEMSFEPYGIGINKYSSYAKFIKEVIYYDKKEASNIFSDKSKIWRSQSQGIYTSWETEHELRQLGDFSLQNIPKSDMILFTRYKKEADQLEQSTGIKSISFLN